MPDAVRNYYFLSSCIAMIKDKYMIYGDDYKDSECSDYIFRLSKKVINEVESTQEAHK